ncbi:sortase [Candidatus Microgenomates bacterium]|nr:sortase [Candidatus Microgenomates bacterium]
MALKTYRKETRIKEKKVATAVSYLSLTAGAFLLFWAFYPVISFELYSRVFFQNGLRSPIPVAKASELSNNVSVNKLTYSNNVRDFTQASMWFPTAKSVAAPDSKTMHSTVPEQDIADVKPQKKPWLKDYYLSIPKLNIKDAHVTVGGENLAESLIHYLPVTMPGENGNVVIFGHSTLPQLYNVKDYKTIFTYLPSLNKGDRIAIKAADVSYQYEIYDMFVVKPDQISVLDQSYDSANVTLITCVPPGTYWNRLVVKARLTALPSL